MPDELLLKRRQNNSFKIPGGPKLDSENSLKIVLHQKRVGTGNS